MVTPHGVLGMVPNGFDKRLKNQKSEEELRPYRS